MKPLTLREVADIEQAIADYEQAWKDRPAYPLTPIPAAPDWTTRQVAGLVALVRQLQRKSGHKRKAAVPA